MQTIADFPYFEVQFNKEGAIFKQDEVKQILDFLPASGVTDLFVISHGWNNDMSDARWLYKSFFTRVRNEINSNRLPQLASRKFAVLGILWPSIKFADEALIPSGAASFSSVQNDEAEIREKLESLKGIFDNPDADARLEEAKQLVSQAQTDADAAAAFVDLMRSLPHKNETHPDDASDAFFQKPADELVDILGRPDVPLPAEGDTGGAAGFEPSAGSSNMGSAAGFSLFGGVLPALNRVLNFVTYYQMKERAGIVGRTGAYQVLMQIRKAQPSLKIHLIGHSFGGRLVTSLANGPDGQKPLLVESMTLLQAAFSHNGFASKFDGKRDGFFRKVVTEQKINGPILITHSDKDIAVGVAYPIASKLSGDDAAAFGNADNRFGGIGRNGAQFTPEADNGTPLSPVTGTYSFKAGKLYNLNGDNIITGHSDVTGAEIVHAFLSAVAST